MAPIIPAITHLSLSLLNGFPLPPPLPLPLAVGLNIPDKNWFTGFSPDKGRGGGGGGGGGGDVLDELCCWLCEVSDFVPADSFGFADVFPST